MPICCVDILVQKKGRILLIRRKNEPEKGKWWVPGGRILKGEGLSEAVRRKVKEETGLEIENERFLGVYEYKSDKACFKDIMNGTHSIVIVYLVEALENQDVKLDETSSDYKWIDMIEEDLDDYIKKILKDSKIFD